ncbi:MAG: aspartyl-phosphate phosphatase Spo0E family protein [Tissierellaceae bacterium]
MNEKYQLKELKEKIEEKRVKLNILTEGNLNEEKVLKLSEELDILINEYYRLLGLGHNKK